MSAVPPCPCCGSDQIRQQPVLWPELVAQWRLSAYEAGYVDRQQGQHCGDCGSNLRAMTLAVAILRVHGFEGLLADFVRSGPASRLRVLEINEAGALSAFLSRMPGHLIARYPEVVMEDLPFGDGTFDLVVHSDTLEHVGQPVRGLSECRRVLAPGGACAFTVPMIVDRLTCSREGLPPSYHGDPSNPVDCLVRTEYGADAWRHVLLAGFRECRIVSMDHPAAHALVATG